MKVYYIHHSSFIVETESSFLLFDFHKSIDNKKSDFNFKDLLNNILQSKKDFYIFVSHSHNDHFNSEIFSWNKENVYYILSSDIRLFKNANNTYFIKQNEKLTVNDIEIDTYGSTDEGVSFLVKSDNLNIFHAGDLNWWKWSDDTKEEAETMESAYKNVIKDISNNIITIDVAFFPVDRRLEENYLCGGQYFIEKISPKIFIPMHFWNEFNTTKDFKDSLKNTVNTRILEIHHPNEVLI